MVWLSTGYWGSSAGLVGFAEEYCMPDGKLEALHAHPGSLPPMYLVVLTPTLACGTTIFCSGRGARRRSTLLPVKLELQHLVDTQSASCHPAWPSRLTEQSGHFLLLSPPTTEIPVCFAVKLLQTIIPILFHSELTNRCACLRQGWLSHLCSLHTVSHPGAAISAFYTFSSEIHFSSFSLFCHPPTSSPLPTPTQEAASWSTAMWLLSFRTD